MLAVKIDEDALIAVLEPDGPLSGSDFHYAATMIDPLIEKAGQAESLRQVLLAALASDRYRIANGEFPQALDRLSPDYLPTPAVDLFTDEPLKYSRNADSMIVYNCGPNLRDDRGGKDDQAIRVFLQKWDPSGDGSLKVD